MLHNQILFNLVGVEGVEGDRENALAYTTHIDRFKKVQ